MRVTMAITTVAGGATASASFDKLQLLLMQIQSSIKNLSNHGKGW
jgi:hypothetical protein